MRAPTKGGTNIRSPTKGGTNMFEKRTIGSYCGALIDFFDVTRHFI